jgi:hypothetical protein
MPYQFRQSQVMAPSRRLAPELAQARDLLKDQLADMSATGRGFSQSECYRTLVMLEALVNEGHNVSPQDIAACAMRVGKVLSSASSRKLSVNDIKAIRRVIRPFTQSNPLLKRDKSRTMRPGPGQKERSRRQKPVEREQEESAYQALPPIAGASAAPSEPDSDDLPRNRNESRMFPARKPRKRGEYDDMILANDAAGIRQVQEEKVREKAKKAAYHKAIHAQLQMQEQRKHDASLRKERDRAQIAAHMRDTEEAKVDEAEKKRAKAEYLRITNENGLIQRQKVLQEEDSAKQSIEQKLLQKAREDEDREQAKHERKRNAQQSEAAKVRTLNDQRRVYLQRQKEEQFEEELRINKEAIEIVRTARPVALAAQYGRPCDLAAPQHSLGGTL